MSISNTRIDLLGHFFHFTGGLKCHSILNGFLSLTHTHQVDTYFFSFSHSVTSLLRAIATKLILRGFTHHYFIFPSRSGRHGISINITFSLRLECSNVHRCTARESGRVKLVESTQDIPFSWVLMPKICDIHSIHDRVMTRQCLIVSRGGPVHPLHVSAQSTIDKSVQY